jgi:hypothetical protein
MRRGVIVAIGAALAMAAAAGSCTFPDFTVNVNADAASSASASTTATGQGGSDGGATGSGAASTSGGGDGGHGAGECGQGGIAGMGGSGGADPCDLDGDNHAAKGPPCCGDDCDDDDSNVFWGQDAYFAVPSKHRGYDYDCDGEEEPDSLQLFNGTGTVTCSELVDCTTAKQGFKLPEATCGDDDQYFQCQLLTVCQAKPAASPRGNLRCH